MSHPLSEEGDDEEEEGNHASSKISKHLRTTNPVIKHITFPPDG